MTNIFKNGGGHVAPLRRPGYSTYYGGFDGGNKSRSNGWHSSGDEESPGRDLVVNRKSLNVEHVRKEQTKIREDNLKFLNRLQKLKPTYDTDQLIDEHKFRGQIVERISKFPLVLDHNCTSPPLELPKMPEK